jgi:hypothetical protein
MKRLMFFLVLLAVFLLPGTSLAYSSNICKSTGGCIESEVGPFMKEISQACGNLGDCTLTDILTVFANVGNFVVGIIGAVVLLMYVIGGFYWLASAGRSEWVTTGKKYMTISTVGLLIVMFSHLGIRAIQGALKYGTFQVEGEYAACTGTPDTEGDACDLNSKCVEGQCLSTCLQTYGTSSELNWDTGIATGHTCVDTKTWATDESLSKDGYWYNSSSCETNKCQGGSNIVCCEYYSRF